MNLDDREDDAAVVQRNRVLALSQLGYSIDQLSALHQIHSSTVCLAQAGWQTGDALVSKQAGLVLAIGTADCYPILFENPVAGVIGAAHAGWRGTVGHIAARTVEAMQDLGARLSDIRAAIGPGITAPCYPVGGDLPQQFAQAGFPAHIWQQGPEQLHLDLAAANIWVLQQAGIATAHIWAMNRCSTESEFFSYRRDAGRTGRMWAVIGL